MTTTAIVEAQVTAPLATLASLDIIPLSTDINDIYKSLLASKHKESTRKTYQSNLNQFSQYLTTKVIKKGTKTTLPQDQVSLVLHQYLALTKKEATCYLAEYQKALLDGGYLPNSINVKIASIKALVNYAYSLEACSYTLDKVKALSPEVYRDTKGTSVTNMAQILAAPDTSTLKGKRDAALLRLLWDCGLRRAEAVNLNWEDFNPGERTLKILAKGRVSREAIALSPKSVASLLDWLDARGAVNPSYPIFTSLDHRYQGDNKRISGKAVYNLVKEYSGSVEGGKVLSPHKIRHSAITAVLDATGGNVRQAQSLSRHKNTDTLIKYDDNRKGEQQKAVNLLSTLA